MAASRSTPASSPTESQDEMTVASHGTTSPFSGEDSFDRFTARMARQLLQDEEMRAQHQSALLRLREKALHEKTKAELAWLKHKEQRLRDKGEDDKMPPIEKRRQEILSKLHAERVEIKRLKAANKAASYERRMLLLQQREISKIHETTKFYLGRLKREAPDEAHQLADLSVSLGESPVSPTMDCEVSEATDHDTSEIIEDIRTASPSSAGGHHMQEKSTSSHTAGKLQQVSGMESSSDFPVPPQHVSHTDITSSSVPEQVGSQSDVISGSDQSHSHALHSLLTSRSPLLVRDQQATSPSSARVLLSESSTLRTLAFRSLHAVDSESHLHGSPTQSPTGQGSTPTAKSLTHSITSPTSSDNGVMRSLRRLEVQSSERYLTKREQKLRKRRQEAQRILKSRKELLEWQNRLDKEEAELQRMVDEAMGLKIRRQRPREIDDSKQAAVEDGESLVLHSSPGAVSSRHEAVSPPPSDVEAVGDHGESSTATVVDDESVGTNYGSETFESLDRTLTTQQENTTLTQAMHGDNTPTAAEIIKLTDDSRTETTEKRRMKSDIEKRIQLLKEVLSQRKAEAKRLHEEKRQRKQALLEEEEAHLRCELETVERTISKHKEELERPPPSPRDSQERAVLTSLLDKTSEKERGVDEQDEQQTAGQSRESMKTPALHELSTYSTFSGKENSAVSQLHAYSGTTFISSSLAHTQVTIEMRDEEQSEKSDEGRQEDTWPTDASLVALHVEQRISSPADDHQRISKSPPSLQELQTSLSKTYTLDAFESSMTSSTPKRQPLTDILSLSLVENGKGPQTEVTYSDTFVPSLQSLDSAINVRPLEDTVIVTAAPSQLISEGSEGDEDVNVVEIAEEQMDISILQVGDRVLVDGNRAGVLQFWGTTHFASGVWAGVELDLPRGSNDGEWEGQRYFFCADHHGTFVASNKVQRLGEQVDRVESSRTKSPLNVVSSHSDIVTTAQTSRKLDFAATPDREQSGQEEDALVDQQLEPAASVEESVSDITPLADDDSELLRIISSAAEAVESFRRSLSPSVATEQDSTSLSETENLALTDIQRPVTPVFPTSSDEMEQEVEETSLTEEQITLMARTQIENEVSRVTASVLDLLVTNSVDVMVHIANDKERERNETEALEHDTTLCEEVQYEEKEVKVLWEAIVDQLLTLLFDEAVKEVQPLVEKRAAEHKYYHYHITKHADDEDTSLDNSSISMSSGISDVEPCILSPDYDTKFPTIIMENREELQKVSVVSVQPAEVPLFIPFDKETVSHVVKSSLHKEEEPLMTSDEHQMAFTELLTDTVHEVSQQLLPMEADKDKSVRVLWRKPRRYHGTEIRRLKTSRQASDLQGLMGLVEDQLCTFLGMTDGTEQSHNVAIAGCPGGVSTSQGRRLNTNTIEGILVEELREEESQWIDYDDDETQIKFQLADGILETLLQETAIVAQGVQNEKLARQEAKESDRQC